MNNDIKPGYAVQASEADYATLARVVSEHNAAAVTGERYWGIALDGGSYTQRALCRPRRPRRSLSSAKKSSRKPSSGRKRWTSCPRRWARCKKKTRCFGSACWK